MILPFGQQISALQGAESATLFCEKVSRPPQTALRVTALYLEESPASIGLEGNVLKMFCNHCHNIVFGQQRRHAVWESNLCLIPKSRQRVAARVPVRHHAAHRFRPNRLVAASDSTGLRTTSWQPPAPCGAGSARPTRQRLHLVHRQPSSPIRSVRGSLVTSFRATNSHAPRAAPGSLRSTTATTEDQEISVFRHRLLRR